MRRMFKICPNNCQFEFLFTCWEKYRPVIIDEILVPRFLAKIENRLTKIQCSLYFFEEVFCFVAVENIKIQLLFHLFLNGLNLSLYLKILSQNAYFFSLIFFIKENFDQFILNFNDIKIRVFGAVKKRNIGEGIEGVFECFRMIVGNVPIWMNHNHRLSNGLVVFPLGYKAGVIIIQKDSRSLKHHGQRVIFNLYIPAVDSITIVNGFCPSHILLILLSYISQIHEQQYKRVMLIQTILILIIGCQASHYHELSYELQYQHDDFLQDFTTIYTPEAVESLSHYQTGMYLLLLGKMYLYDILPSSMESQSRYLLAYHYLKEAAENYQNANAYYYLAILQYLKFVPTVTIRKNIQNKPQFGNLVQAMNTSHLHNIQHNLYLSSILGNSAAEISMAYMFKEGIGTEKNCSASLAYYLSVIKQKKIQTFQFPSEYDDQENFEKLLYSNEKANFEHYGEDDISSLLETDFFDDESIRAYEEIAKNYQKGQNGFRRNHSKAFEIYERIAQAGNKVAKFRLGNFYLRGQGVSVNYEKAKKYFQSIQKSLDQAQQMLIVMKYLNLGFKDKRPLAIKQMQKKFDQYDKKVQSYSRYDVFSTAYLKFLTATLVLAGNIKGGKDTAIRLIEEAAKQGNIFAITTLGLIFADGSDVSYDCKRAIEYFNDEAYSRFVFQEKLQTAKMGIKKERFMFSFIKYTQLMMIGYDNAFINGYYLMKVYGNQILKITENSWSLKVANQNEHYRFLRKNKIITSIEQSLTDLLNPYGSRPFNSKNLQEYTQGNSQTIRQYQKYLEIKILTLGIKVNKLGLLKFYKYKMEEKSDLSTLSQLANQNGQNAYILESRFLLGKYYQNQANKQSEQVRKKTAIQEYTRATKSPFFANIIYLIEGGTLPDSHILNDLIMYLTFLMAVGIFLYWKKNRRMQEILREQSKRLEEKMREEERQRQMEESKQEEQMKSDKDRDQPEITVNY